MGQIRQTRLTAEETRAKVYTGTTTESTRADAGSLKNRFDKDRVQNEIDLQITVSQNFSQNWNEARAETGRRRDHWKEQYQAGKITAAEYREKIEDLDRAALALDTLGMGLSTQSNSLSGSLIAAASPAVTQKIGESFKAGGAWKDYQNTPVHWLAQGAWAAAVAYGGGNNAAAAGLSAAAVEALAPEISRRLYGTKDPEQLILEQKQSVGALVGLLGTATGAAVGNTPADAAQGGLSAQNTVGNNSLHIDKNGVVIRNIPDNDYNIYRYNYVCSPIPRNNCLNLTDFNKLYNSPKTVIGQVMWQDSFTSPESGKPFGIIHFGENIEPYVYQLNDKT